MVTLASLQKSNISTDRPMESAVYLQSGSFSVPASTTNHYHAISHGLPFTPLIGGSWSLNSDFAVQYPYSSGPVSTSSSVHFDQEAIAFADTTNIYIYSDNYSGTAKTIYFRLHGLQPTTVDYDLQATAAQGDTFSFDSKYNMLRVLSAIVEDMPATGASPYNLGLTHGLNTIFLASGWYTSNTYNGTSTTACIHPIGTRLATAGRPLFAINTLDQLFVVNPVSSPATTVHIRIYL